MPHLKLLIALTAFSLSTTVVSAPQVSRKELLAVDIHPQGQVGRVTIQEITLSPSLRAPPHSHPCPVVGTVTRGKIVYQIDGQPAQTLTTGSAFYEPANTRITRFDNADSVDSTFQAFYLCKNQDELVCPHAEGQRIKR
ncbi:hypothetical protein JHS3_13430 [Jeongeupia sp. HS-3]|nr:hypothetical protein JHS3_13430 [Jeongeupia sp. HS-3]